MSGIQNPMHGKKVYSAGVIAAYTALANVPVGCILYGMNLSARGARRYAALSVGFGILSGIALLAVLLFSGSIVHIPLLRFVAALSVYTFEKRPVAEAIRLGATRARWWPPALIIHGIVAVLFVIQIAIKRAQPSPLH